MNFGKKINEKPVIGEVKVKGIRYYVDIDKKIYSEVNGEYVQVTDNETLKDILDNITTRSIDVR